MTQSDATKWNARYAETTTPETSPIPFLSENIHRLGSGRALVLAAGRGRNAVFLAECGFDVTALDVSKVGLAQCDELARSHGVSVETVCADLDEFDLGESRYDLITKIYYYEPSLFPAIRRALKRGGHFLFQTFSVEHASVGTFGPKNPAYLASQSPVLDPFASDHLLHYQDIVLHEADDTEAIIQMIVRVP